MSDLRTKTLAGSSKKPGIRDFDRAAETTTTAREHYALVS
jgi:hypothetical protein